MPSKSYTWPSKVEKWPAPHVEHQPLSGAAEGAGRASVTYPLAGGAGLGQPDPRSWVPGEPVLRDWCPTSSRPFLGGGLGKRIPPSPGLQSACHPSRTGTQASATWESSVTSPGVCQTRSCAPPPGSPTPAARAHLPGEGLAEALMQPDQKPAPSWKPQATDSWAGLWPSPVCGESLSLWRSGCAKEVSRPVWRRPVVSARFTPDSSRVCTHSLAGSPRLHRAAVYLPPAG